MIVQSAAENYKYVYFGISERAWSDKGPGGRDKHIVANFTDFITWRSVCAWFGSLGEHGCDLYLLPQMGLGVLRCKTRNLKWQHDNRVTNAEMRDMRGRFQTLGEVDLPVESAGAATPSIVHGPPDRTTYLENRIGGPVQMLRGVGVLGCCGRLVITRLTV